MRTGRPPTLHPRLYRGFQQPQEKSAHITTVLYRLNDALDTRGWAPRVGGPSRRPTEYGHSVDPVRGEVVQRLVRMCEVVVHHRGVEPL